MSMIDGLWPTQLSETYLRPVQLAERLGVEPRVVQGWCRRDSLPVRRVGSRYRIHTLVGLQGDLRAAWFRMLETMHPDLPSLLMYPPPPLSGQAPSPTRAGWARP